MATVDNYGNECADLRAEVEALRAERDNLIRLANGIIQATAAPDALPRTIAERDVALDQLAALRAQLAAAEQRAEKAEAALPPAGILSDIRTITATYAFIGTSGVSFSTAVRCGERVQAWLSALPTPEAQP